MINILNIKYVVLVIICAFLNCLLLSLYIKSVVSLFVVQLEKVLSLWSCNSSLACVGGKLYTSVIVWLLMLFYDRVIPYMATDLYLLTCSMQATFDCLLKTYGFLTPDFWRETRFSKSPFQEYTDLLAKPTGKILHVVDEVEA